MTEIKRRIYNAEEAAQQLNMSRATLYRLAKAQQIPCRKIRGVGIGFTDADIDEILADAYRPAKAS